MSFASLLANRCTIQRSVRTNQAGVVVSAWSDNTTGVRCLVQEGPGRVMGHADGRSLDYEATAFFPAGTDLRPDGTNDKADRIVMTKPATGTTYLVVKVGDESGMGHHLTAYLKRMRSDGS